MPISLNSVAQHKLFLEKVMSNSLFRKEALEANKAKSIGSVALYCPPWRWVIISLAGLVTVATLLLVFFGSYTKRETMTGALVPVDGVIDIVAVSAGTIVELPIQEGQSVKKGSTIATLSSEISTRYGQTRESIARQLSLQNDALEQELKNLDILSAETLRGDENQKNFLEQQLKKLEGIYASRLRQVRLAEGQLKKLKLMRDEGYASNRQVEEQEVSLLEAQSRAQDVARQQIDLQQQLTRVLQQMREHPINKIDKINDINRRLSELKQAMMENESRRSIVLNAPLNATIASVLVKQGQMVNAGQTVASLLPENAALQARMMVSSRAIGFIVPGQRVTLRYQAYPWQKFGQQYGVVSDVSRVSLSPQEVSAITGNSQVNEQHYIVKVKLDKQFIHAYGQQVKLQPGSALEADFLIDKRRLYEWVLEPLYALRRSSTL
ncbi:HlyD family secretion protein [Citrobacter rodentium]|uniref:Microcin secretion protein n=3 Tax=Citrobacter rodentium TaxID=67825 RepID=D2TK23_CITRI|nr:HlyD family efflux transporter periplasmic adaptor subunit [Citrobacter rodentium]CBG87153.1 microcin secretion protein [Citrobacter rodentium ICC168]